MMKLNRILSFFLSLALVASLVVAPASAATFADVKDPAVARATELLAALEIVSGDGNGSFRPQSFFTRAEFCKMALVVLGRGGEAALQSNRVIFKDVTATHWALGYVNAASSRPDEKTEPLVRGRGNSLFEPDKAITYAEAVTILLRVLGYGETDIATGGGLWYAGALAQAERIGLTQGLSHSGTDPLTRGEAALLFERLLYTKPKDGKDIFFTSNLGGSITDSALVLSVTATTPDGEKNAIKTTAGVYKTNHLTPDAALVGTKVKLVLNKAGKVLAIQPDKTVTTRTIRLTSAPESRFLKAENDEKIIIPEATKIWRADKETTTYKEFYSTMKLGSLLILAYDTAGNLDYIYFLGEGAETSSMVAMDTTAANPFKAITGSGTDFTVYKNGSPAKLSDVRQYDAGTYNVSTGVLSISDRRLTGVYANAAPSPASPSKITVMGCSFDVLDCALTDLEQFKIGDPITLLLTNDGKVAGAVKPSVLSATAVGVVTEIKKEDTAEHPDLHTVTVELANITTADEKNAVTNLSVSGTVSMSAVAAKSISGKLVTVTSQKLKELTLKELPGSGAADPWNVEKGTIGTLKVADGLAIYERIGNSKLYPVSKKSVTVAEVPAKRITYVGLNWSGEVDLLVLDDVTGDHYAYGLAVYTPPKGSESVWDYQNGTLSVDNHTTLPEGKPVLVTGADFTAQGKAQLPMGIAGSLETVDNKPRLAKWLELQKATGIRRSAFEEGFVTVDGVKFPMDPNLDAHCYNATTKTFFASLAEAKAYSARLTVYYDRPAAEGGKIRLVVVGQ